MNGTPPAGLVDRIRHHLVGLKMPRALEVLDQTLRRLECGEIGAPEALEALLGEELTLPRGSGRAQDEPVAQYQAPERLWAMATPQAVLLVPALARPQPYPHPGPARVHRPP